MAQSPQGHAALMDKVYRRQRYVYDLTRKYYLFGRDRMIRGLAVAPGQSVLEVGCGTARNLIRIARLYPGAELYGLDASSEMLRTAADNVAHAGLSSRIRLFEGYAENVMPQLFGRTAPFDRILFPYSLSMIPDWRQALKAAQGALSEEGSLHVVDFGDLAGLPSPAAGLLRRWLGLFHVKPRVEILQVLEADSAGKALKSGHLTLLPGRYAFVWSGNRDAIEKSGSFHVAP